MVENLMLAHSLKQWYNHTKDLTWKWFAMDGKCDIRELSYKLNFMYKKIPVPKKSMAYWMTIPEFLDEMLEKVEHSETIDCPVVYESMQRIYDQMYLLRIDGRKVDFNFRLARRSINYLKGVLNIP